MAAAAAASTQKSETDEKKKGRGCEVCNRPTTECGRRFAGGKTQWKTLAFQMVAAIETDQPGHRKCTETLSSVIEYLKQVIECHEHAEESAKSMAIKTRLKAGAGRGKFKKSPSEQKNKTGKTDEPDDFEFQCVECKGNFSNSYKIECAKCEAPLCEDCSIYCDRCDHNWCSKRVPDYTMCPNDSCTDSRVMCYSCIDKADEVYDESGPICGSCDARIPIDPAPEASTVAPATGAGGAKRKAKDDDDDKGSTKPAQSKKQKTAKQSNGTAAGKGKGDGADS